MKNLFSAAKTLAIIIGVIFGIMYMVGPHACGASGDRQTDLKPSDSLIGMVEIEVAKKIKVRNLLIERINKATNQRDDIIDLSTRKIDSLNQLIKKYNNKLIEVETFLKTKLQFKRAVQDLVADPIEGGKK